MLGYLSRNSSFYQTGGSSGNRTSDTGIFSPLLYRLSYEAIWRSRRGSNPRSSAWQADVLTSCTTRPLGCGERIWTSDLWVMSPTSYRTAPPRDINYINKNGGGKGIRTPAPLAWPPGFQDRSLQPDLGIPPRWCLRPDLNRHEGWFSQDFKSCASTNSATQAHGDLYEIRTHDPLIKSQMLYQLS